MLDLNGTLIICAVCFTYVMLFALCVYLQTRNTECPVGPTGPEGSIGPPGDEGYAGSGASVYIQNVGVDTSVAATTSTQPQRLPSNGVPWKTLLKDGDSALATFSFTVGNASLVPALQSSVEIFVTTAGVRSPFRSSNTAATIRLLWDRPPGLTNGVQFMSVRVTRNSDSTMIVTPIEGCRFTSSQPFSGNVFCANVTFTVDDIFVSQQATIPVASPESIVSYGSTIDVQES